MYFTDCLLDGVVIVDAEAEKSETFLSMILDMLATLLAAGISQVYLCISPEIFNNKALEENLLNEIIDYSHDVEPMHPGNKVYYPGERTLQTRARNLKNGITVSEEVWQQVMELLA